MLIACRWRLPIISPDLSPPVTDAATGDSGSTSARCPLCQLPLGSVECFDSHTERDGAVYKCRVCDYQVGKKAELKRHVRRHTGEKPFSCPHCSLHTSHRQNIFRHIRTVHRGAYHLYFCENISRNRWGIVTPACSSFLEYRKDGSGTPPTHNQDLHCVWTVNSHVILNA